MDSLMTVPVGYAKSRHCSPLAIQGDFQPTGRERNESWTSLACSIYSVGFSLEYKDVKAGGFIFYVNNLDV